MSLMDDMQNDLRDVFFNTEDFAEPVIYSPVSGSSYTVNGIFDNAYESVSLEGTIPVASTSPMLRVREASLLSTPAPGDTVSVRSVWYNVIEPEPDGQGVMKLRLHEANS